MTGWWWGAFVQWPVWEGKAGTGTTGAPAESLKRKHRGGGDSGLAKQPAHDKEATKRGVKWNDGARVRT